MFLKNLSDVFRRGLIRAGLTIIDSITGPGLIDYINEKFRQVRTVLYTDISKITQEVIDSDIFIIGEEVASEDIIKRCKGIKFILSGTAGEVTGTGFGRTYYLPRYLPADCLLNLIYKRLLEEDIRVSGFGNCFSDKKTVTFFSLACSDVLSDISFDYARLLSEEKRVLYLNLMPYEYRFSESGDLGDLFYYLRVSKLSLDQIIAGIKTNIGNLDIIASFGQPMDLSDISDSDFENLILRLREETDYQTIVVSLPPVPAGIFEFFMCSDEFYYVGIDNEISENYRHRLVESLDIKVEKSAKDDFSAEEKIRNLILPPSLYRELRWSDMSETSGRISLDNYIRKYF